MDDDELIDIVDEEGNVLEMVAKSSAHQSGALHKTVIAGVLNRAGQIMLVKQTADRQDAGQFVNPAGGHIKSGETEVQALFREVAEEIGISEFKHNLIGRAIYNRQILGRLENHYFILFEIITDQTPVLGDEAESYEWFSEEDLKELLRTNPAVFGDSYKFVLNQFYPHLLANA